MPVTRLEGVAGCEPTGGGTAPAIAILAARARRRTTRRWSNGAAWSVGAPDPACIGVRPGLATLGSSVFIALRHWFRQSCAAPHSICELRAPIVARREVLPSCGRHRYPASPLAYPSHAANPDRRRGDHSHRYRHRLRAVSTLAVARRWPPSPWAAYGRIRADRPDRAADLPRLPSHDRRPRCALPVVLEPRRFHPPAAV